MYFHGEVRQIYISSRQIPNFPAKNPFLPHFTKVFPVWFIILTAVFLLASIGLSFYRILAQIEELKHL